MKPTMRELLQAVHQWHFDNADELWFLPHEVAPYYASGGGSGRTGERLRTLWLRGYVERRERTRLFERGKPTYEYQITQAGRNALRREDKID